MVPEDETRMIIEGDQKTHEELSRIAKLQEEIEAEINEARNIVKALPEKDILSMIDDALVAQGEYARAITPDPSHLVKEQKLRRLVDPPRSKGDDIKIKLMLMFDRKRLKGVGTAIEIWKKLLKKTGNKPIGGRMGMSR